METKHPQKTGFLVSIAARQNHPMKTETTTTPKPAPMSKDAIAQALRKDRRTISAIIRYAEIQPCDIAPSGRFLYDLATVKEELDAKEAEKLPPMSDAEIIASLTGMLDFAHLALDALADRVPPSTMKEALLEAQERQRAGKEPERLWLFHLIPQEESQPATLAPEPS
jgi:hypothetical protein